MNLIAALMAAVVLLVGCASPEGTERHDRERPQPQAVDPREIACIQAGNRWDPLLKRCQVCRPGPYGTVNCI
jgi:hypothetical protein